VISVPGKAPGIYLLILDRHASHCSSPELLQFAKENNVIMLFLLCHTIAALQCLGKLIFDPFKTILELDANCSVSTHQNRKLTRTQLICLVECRKGLVQ
jgi:hypothetical protein